MWLNENEASKQLRINVGLGHSRKSLTHLLGVQPAQTKLRSRVSG